MNKHSAALAGRSRSSITVAMFMWGLIAVVATLTDELGLFGGILAMSFALLGPGVAFALALRAHLGLALRISVTLGGGLATCAGIGQALILVGLYSPTAVICAELALAIGVLLLAARARQLPREAAS